MNSDASLNRSACRSSRRRWAQASSPDDHPPVSHRSRRGHSAERRCRARRRSTTKLAVPIRGAIWRVVSRLIHIDLHEPELQHSVRQTVNIVGDAKEALQALLGRIEAVPSLPNNPGLSLNWRETLREQNPSAPSEGGLRSRTITVP